MAPAFESVHVYDMLAAALRLPPAPTRRRSGRGAARDGRATLAVADDKPVAGRPLDRGASRSARANGVSSSHRWRSPCSPPTRGTTSTHGGTASRGTAARAGPAAASHHGQRARAAAGEVVRLDIETGKAGARGDRRDGDGVRGIPMPVTPVPATDTGARSWGSISTSRLARTTSRSRCGKAETSARRRTETLQVEGRRFPRGR